MFRSVTVCVAIFCFHIVTSHDSEINQKIVRLIVGAKDDSRFNERYTPSKHRHTSHKHFLHNSSVSATEANAILHNALRKVHFHAIPDNHPEPMKRRTKKRVTAIPKKSYKLMKKLKKKTKKHNVKSKKVHKPPRDDDSNISETKVDRIKEKSKSKRKFKKSKSTYRKKGEDSSEVNSSQEVRSKIVRSPSSKYPKPFEEVDQEEVKVKKVRRSGNKLDESYYLLQDLDEAEFLSKEKDYETVNVHAKRLWR